MKKEDLMSENYLYKKLDAVHMKLRHGQMFEKGPMIFTATSCIVGFIFLNIIFAVHNFSAIINGHTTLLVLFIDYFREVTFLSAMLLRDWIFFNYLVLLFPDSPVIKPGFYMAQTTNFAIVVYLGFIQ